jgi:hypothetical protein
MNPRRSPVTELGSYIAGQVWYWIEYTTIADYEKSISAKEFERWKKVIERYKVQEVERKLDGDAA